MALKNINIDFPFKNSPRGEFLNLNQIDSNAIKADLVHLIMTNKGERLYLPDFGTNLRNYIFNQNDSISYSDIKDEIVEAVKKYLPNLKVNNIIVEQATDNEYVAVIRIDYTITDEVFESNDFIIIKI